MAKQLFKDILQHMQIAEESPEALVVKRAVESYRNYLHPDCGFQRKIYVKQILDLKWKTREAPEQERIWELMRELGNREDLEEFLQEEDSFVSAAARSSQEAVPDWPPCYPSCHGDAVPDEFFSKKDVPDVSKSIPESMPGLIIYDMAEPSDDDLPPPLATSSSDDDLPPPLETPTSQKETSSGDDPIFQRRGSFQRSSFQR